MSFKRPVLGRVSVVIPTRNRLSRLLRCIKSVLDSSYPDIEVIVVDDHSDTDVSTEVSKRFPEVKMFRNDKRMLLAYSRNLGGFKSNGEYILFVDDDNVLHPTAINELIAKASSSDKVAVVAPVAYYWDRPELAWTYHIQKGRIPGFYILHTSAPKNGDITFGFHNAFLVKRRIFEEIGGFDANVLPMHFTELDFAHQVRRLGYVAVVAKEAKVWHDFGGTRHSRFGTHPDSRRAYYYLRNRIILMKRYTSLAERITYFVAVLPLLTLYYSAYFSANSTDGGFRTGLNLVRGVVQGLTHEERRRPQKLTSTQTPRILANSPLVSVIIPTKNVEDTVGACLESIGQQTYPNIEVVVVDNFSRDRTREIASKFDSVRFYSKGPERSSQVNYGVLMAKGEYVYRVDADFVLEPRVVEEAVRACELGGCDIVAVHNTSDPKVSFWSKVRKLERDCYRDDALSIAARFFRKNAFGKVKGFDESLIASEDYDLHIRLIGAGFKLGRIRSQEMHIREPKSLSEVALKHLFYGKFVNRFIKKHPDVWMLQLNPVRLAYLRHWRNFTVDPKLTLGFVVYQFVRYAAAVIGYLAEFPWNKEQS